MTGETNDTNKDDHGDNITLTHGDKKLYVNELLCFVSHHLHSGGAAPENIKWVALSFYDGCDPWFTVSGVERV